VESYAKFLGGILRCHDGEIRSFEMAVERIVWDYIKTDIQNKTSGSEAGFNNMSLPLRVSLPPRGEICILGGIFTTSFTPTLG
jgi:hypothetical protein